MANFAKIGLNNQVLSVVTVNNLETMDEDGTLNELIGIEKLKTQTGHETWVLCGLDLNNKIIRKNIPGPGWFYDQEYDGFHLPRPLDMNGNICASWIFDGTSCIWKPPIEKPNNYFKNSDSTHEVIFQWDENYYQQDNTKGWIEID